MKSNALDFDWDEENIKHVSSHEVTTTEAEETIWNDPFDLELQIDEEGDGEERLLQIGETNAGRILQILTTWRNQKVRVISAWDAPAQLKTYYLERMKNIYGDS